MTIDLLACVGLMFIVKYGTILNGYRKVVMNLHSKLEELHKCSLCLGFWSGVIIACIEWWLIHNNDKHLILLPLASAGVCWIADNINNLIQSHEIKIDRELDL
jgi:hypothetical protein